MSVFVFNRVVEAISSGAYRDSAARYAGVHPDRLTAWMRRGRRDQRREEHSEYRRLFEAVTEAENAEIIKACKTISFAKDKDWKAAYAYLRIKDPRYRERKDKDQATAQAVVNVQNNIGIGVSADPSADPLDAKYDRLSEDERKQLRRLLAKAAGRGTGIDGANGVGIKALPADIP